MTTCADIIARSNAAFGTSGVRGVVEDLDDATCFAYALAFLDHLKQNHGLEPGTKVWIGHDLRPSSPRMARACIAAIENAGCVAESCGVISTPALAFSALSNKQSAIMVTGSHIPFDRNGIKFYRPDGEMLKEDEAPVVDSEAEFPFGLFTGTALADSGTKIKPNASAHESWHARYVDAFGDLLKEMRIGHYQHSAAGRDQLASLLEALGAEIAPLGRSDVFIPIDTEAVSDSDKRQARSWCHEHKLDALISTDGDGDRPLLADENGIYFRGDTLGILAALALGADTVVTPVSSNTALEKSGLFDATHRTKIGSPHVIATMQETAKNPDARVVGFEANGGFLTASTFRSPWTGTKIAPLPTRDAVLPVLATIMLSKQRNLPLSELTSLLPRRVTASDRLENTPKAKSQSLMIHLKANAQAAFDLVPDSGAVIGTDDTDGLRLTFSNADILHMRPSGNAPELRLYVESDSEDRAQKLLKRAKTQAVEMIG